MSKLSILRTGNTITVSDGVRTRQSVCASASAAKGLETRLSNDRALALKWMRGTEPVQLSLPLPEPEPRPKPEPALPPETSDPCPDGTK
jgi:hypothetical protein